MMTSTHALSGATVGAMTGAVAPELLPAAVVVGFVAGVLPDLDLLWRHRRTTHFPVYGPVAGGCVTVIAALSGSSGATLVAVAVLAFALHPLMDVLCGGVEVRPWEATSERAVYDHARGHWVRPRRLVRYAGAPEDMILASAVALPALFLTTGTLRRALVAVLAVSVVFVAVRRRLAPLSERLFADDTGDT